MERSLLALKVAREGIVGQSPELVAELCGTP